MLTIKKAMREDVLLRMGLIGPSGSGKTYTSLSIAKGIGKICVIDSEHGSSEMYANNFDFDVIVLEDDFSPLTYVDAIRMVSESKKYDVLIIDGLSQAWSGKFGALEQVDMAAQKSQSNNRYFAWRDVTPRHNQLIDAMLRCPLHLIATMRSKTEYVIEKDEKGKVTPKKIGISPIQREGMEYEFHVVADITLDNDMIISKTRLPELYGGFYHQPDEQFGRNLLKYLKTAAPSPGRTAAKKLEPVPATPTADSVTPTAVEYLSEATSRKLYQEAKKVGFTTEMCKNVLASIGLTSFKEIPVDRYEEVANILLDKSKAQEWMK